MAGEVTIPVNTRNKILTPIETSTRVPLAIWAPGEGKTNRHHAHFYKTDFEDGPRGNPNRAVRFSRLQDIRKGPHKAVHNMLAGTLMPQSLSEAYGVTLFNCVGYVPRFVIDMTMNDSTVEDRIREITPSMREALQRPGVFTIEKRRSCREEIGQFLMNYAIWQQFGEDDQRQVEQFLAITPEQAAASTELHQRRLRLGTRLIGKGIEYAVDPINDEYSRARKELTIPEGSPVCAWWVVKNYISGHEPMYFGELTESLQSQLAVAA